MQLGNEEDQIDINIDVITEVLVNTRDIVEARNVSLQPLINVCICCYHFESSNPDSRLNYLCTSQQLSVIWNKEKRRELGIKTIFSYTTSNGRLGGAWERDCRLKSHTCVFFLPIFTTCNDYWGVSLATGEFPLLLGSFPCYWGISLATVEFPLLHRTSMYKKVFFSSSSADYHGCGTDY